MVKLPILVLLVAFLTWAYHATQSPPPTICGSANGPPVTALRIKLRDGRHLAYVERGVSKEVASYKIITVHGISSCKDLILPASQEVIEELGIYIVSYDRAGYGESDPYSNRSVKSEVYDLEELADQLHFGDKFYVFGMSMGACTIWGCLKYIPHRIAGAAMAVPLVNYWWPSLPSDLLKNVSKGRLLQDRVAINLAHHTPRLYSWVSQRWFSRPEIAKMSTEVFSPKDKEILKIMSEKKSFGENKALQQGVFESLHREVLVGFGNWGFDPLELKNPETTVHIWQGYEDRLVPVLLQRHVAERLPWIRYHEVSNAGHLLAFTDNFFDEILKALFISQEATGM